MKESIVLLIATLMVLSTVAVTADTNNESPEPMLAVISYISHSQQTNIFNPDWIHFSDGQLGGCIGLLGGGTFEWAVRFTPDELADWAGYEISVVRFHYGHPDLPSSWMPGNIKIYEEGTSTQPGSLITSESFEVFDNDWFDVELSKPVLINGNEDIWISVEGITSPGQIPAGYDRSPTVKGKGFWFYVSSVGWFELGAYDVNWNIWAKVEEPSDPPEKPHRPDGPTEGVVGVEYTLSTSTTDPEEEQVSYLWDWGDGTSTEWTVFYDSGATACASHIWTEAEMYEIMVKAKDVHDVESEWSDPKTIHIVDIPILEIGNITGKLFKVSTVIRNIGSVDATIVNWSIVLNGGIILMGKETTGNILILPAGDETKISSGLIFGFGKTVIIATAECDESSDTTDRDAFVLLFFML